MPDELLEVVDEAGVVVGRAPRSALHGGSRLLHRVVHVLVTEEKGRILLQRRSSSKDIAPGKWDTSVGGHVAPGETPLGAALREMREELGIAGVSPEYLYRWVYSGAQERELVDTWRLTHAGPFAFDRHEIEEVRFWDQEEIRREVGTGIFSRQFEEEFARYMARQKGG